VSVSGSNVDNAKQFLPHRIDRKALDRISEWQRLALFVSLGSKFREASYQSQVLLRISDLQKAAGFEALRPPWS